MSKGYRNGAFALGLVTGGGIVLNLVLWSAYKAREGIPQNPENSQSHPWVSFWDWLITTFINPYDTIAQWGMAVLSLAAVYLLWETLKASRQTLSATRDMARDTQRIGEAQVRAYLSFDGVESRYILDPSKEEFTAIQLRPYIRNTGQTPANIRITRSAVVVMPERPTQIDVQGGTGGRVDMRVGAQAAVFLAGGAIDWKAAKDAIEKEKYIILICGVEFEDVFFQEGSKKRTEDFAVRIVFNKSLTDPRAPVEVQPTVEWHDLQLESINLKP